jgi:hypothetical protein
MNDKIREKYLDNFYSRGKSLGDLIPLVNNAFITVFLAFFVITFHSINFVIFLICICSLFFWRVYVHYIDQGIIQNYENIVDCELELEIQGNFEKNITLQGNLKKQAERSWFFYRNRGQRLFDILALLIMIGLNAVYFFPDRKLQFENIDIIFASIIFVSYCGYFFWQDQKDLAEVKRIYLKSSSKKKE